MDEHIGDGSSLLLEDGQLSWSGQDSMNLPDAGFARALALAAGGVSSLFFLLCLGGMSGPWAGVVRTAGAAWVSLSPHNLSTWLT